MTFRPFTPAACRSASQPERAAPSAPAPRSCSAPRAGDAPVYGVNTGFGKLASTRIAADELAALQLNLIRSHAVGVGEPLPAPVVRLMLRSRRPAWRAATRACAKKSSTRCWPCTTPASCRRPVAGLGRRLRRPRAARAHGAGADRRGRVRVDGERVPGGAGAARRRHRAAALAAKEGLALINGTQVSTALRAARAADASSRCSKPRWSSARSRSTPRAAATARSTRASTRCAASRGRSTCAQYYRALLAGSEIRRSHLHRRRPRAGPVQPALPAAGDRRLPRPAAPRGAGAGARGQRRHRQPAGVRRRRRELVSGGNFHAEPVALAADALAVAIAEIGAIAERRIAMLIDAAVSRLPPFLTRRAGPELRLHDRARDRRGAGLARTSRSRTRPASTACPPRPTRRTTCRWPPSPRGGCSR